MRNTTSSRSQMKNRRKPSKKRCSLKKRRTRAKNRRISRKKNSRRHGGSSLFLKKDPILPKNVKMDSFFDFNKNKKKYPQYTEKDTTKIREYPALNGLPFPVTKEISSYLTYNEKKELASTTPRAFQDFREIVLDTDNSFEYLSDKTGSQKKHGIASARDQVCLTFVNIDFNAEKFVTLKFNTMSDVKKIDFTLCEFRVNIDKNDVIRDVGKVSFFDCSIPNLSFLSSMINEISIRNCTIKHTFLYLLDDVPKLIISNVIIKYDDEGDEQTVNFWEVEKGKIIDSRNKSHLLPFISNRVSL